MKLSRHLRRADKFLNQMEEEIQMINTKLKEELGDVSLVHQPGDGWCLLFDGDHIAPVDHIDLNELVNMYCDDAMEYLRERSI